MRPRNNAFNIFLINLLLTTTSNHASHLEEDKTQPTNTEETPVEEFLEEPSIENDFSVESATTTEHSTTMVTDRKIASIVPEARNISRRFRPSAHLGEIKEPRINTNPFNNVQQIRFENEVDPNSYREQLRNYQLVIEPIHQPTQTDHFGHHHQNSFEILSGSMEEDKNEGTAQNSYVKFQDVPTDVPRIHYVIHKQPEFHQQMLHPEHVGSQYDLIGHQQSVQNTEKPVHVPDVSVLYGKPSNFHVDSLKHELGSYSTEESTRSPYLGAFYEHQNHPAGLHDTGTATKPNNGVVYVQESTFMRTRKVPYTFYQPGVGYHQVEFVNDDHMAYPVRKRVSPWKRILHLIGAFLPLGLLLAALTPNVVRVENTTQPNIVLSKWRVADLPVEHKQVQLDRERSSRIVCEERSVCELIANGGAPGSSVLQNLLWNIATGTSTRVANENGLREVFEAVKRKDCTKVACADGSV
ncbi:hypothetical protein WN55_05038 [Dufourea novaeangliae]|uniref:Uncharacterized protein n=1 Tax=Dufourea novaeangliae TaxID=178035 RepID=A0A154PP21_DUFNO|nr:hypothetical protein WN55_05038 [Dufourea novaeangliae]